jgi:hypothetical protein
MRRTIVVSFVLLLASSAAAQAPADPADALFRQGNALYKEQKWSEAREAYAGAWKLKRAHDIAANLAYAELKLGRFRDAAEHLAFAVRVWPPTGKSDKREFAVERLQLARKEVGALRVAVDVPRAEVLVDGVVVGEAPLEGEVFVEAGSHVVEARLAGYETATQRVEAAKGSAQEVALAMVAVKAEPPPVVVVAPTGPNRGVLIAGGVIGGVALVTGAIFAGLSNSKAKDADDEHTALAMTGPTPCAGASGASTACTDIVAAANAKRTFANASFWSFVGAGMVGTGTLIYALAIPKSATPAALRVLPAAGPQGAGIEIGGAW